jgi:hypothetical protein|tara:strand:+ start:134 stop:277 length:144 start_codon:yes stop_codon:yes gene_type:complete
MKITEEQVNRVNQVINTLPIAFLKQAQEIVKILNESVEEAKKEKDEV